MSCENLLLYTVYFIGAIIFFESVLLLDGKLYKKRVTIENCIDLLKFNLMIWI